MPPHQDVQCGEGFGQVSKRRQWAAAEDEEGETGAVDWKGEVEEHSEEWSSSPPSIIL